jgi:hypothetical protein
VTNQRRTWLIVLVGLIFVLGAVGVDRLYKQAYAEGQTSGIASGIPEGSIVMSADELDSMMMSSEHEGQFSDDDFFADCEESFGEAGEEELEANGDDPCADFDEDGFGEGDFSDGDFVDGDYAEAGFYDEGFGGHDDDYGYEDDYGLMMALPLLGLLLEAVVIGLVAAGTILWVQRRNANGKAVTKAKK